RTDCPQGDDETCDTCPPLKPTKCPTSGECIMDVWMCNNRLDCADGWDERNCTECPSANPFRCNVTESCLPLAWICDGTPDCGTAIGGLVDSSDEDDCNACPEWSPS
ncbi:unnamed protein product, partial [Meganyctiphanes norvegica]